MVSWLPLKKVARRISELEEPVVVCHIDADGLTSGGIMYRTLQLMGKDAEIIPIRQLDENNYGRIPWDRELIFTDLGSGQLEWTREHVIIDHHQPGGDAPYQFNPHTIGINGRETSSSALAYLVSRKLVGDTKLVGPAVVGMVGDRATPLKGVFREFLKTPWVKEVQGLKYFGRETRSLPIMLKYMSDPFVPGLSGELGACFRFIRELGLDEHKTFHQLGEDEQKKLTDALVKYASTKGVPVHKMIGRYYLLPYMPEGTEMRDASEFSTLLNACGRHDRPEIGIGLVTGQDVYDEAKKLLAKHRRLLSRGIEELQVKGTEKFRNFHLFVSDTVKPTLVGIVAGIAISSHMVDHSQPIIALSRENGGWKVSGRATLELVERGINVGLAMRAASDGIGMGGGHDVAAGAFVPDEQIDLFLERLDRELGKQVA